MRRPPSIHHCTSEPYRFFGREAEVGLLDEALAGGAASVVALAGPGGQGKTAIVQHWLHRLPRPVDGLFFWSFYRGKDVDLCLREWLAYAEGLVSNAVASKPAQAPLSVSNTTRRLAKPAVKRAKPAVRTPDTPPPRASRPPPRRRTR